MSLFEKKNQFVASVNESLGNAVREGIFHLNTGSEALDGRHITVKGDKRVLNFGSCSYLGLEMDPRLKQGAIDAILQYGTQFSSSRAYLSCGLYPELEGLLSQMFGAHAIVSASTTLGHLSSIPTLVSDNDAVITDHQVHGSVQNAVQLLRPRGVHVEMIRHNDLNALENKIKELRNTHYRIWYMADGVYSMYGDYAPLKELYALMDKYPPLHLYIDDAHGMSWAGPNGTGYALSQVKLREKVYLATSLNKAFAAGGGALIFTDPKDMNKVRTCGSSFVFSGPLQPASLGAGIASAKIHLSPEIYQLQNSLRHKLDYCDQLLREKKLPYVFSSGSPIFYIGLGIPAMGYNMVNRLMDEGFYVDIGIFPGVPLKRTGLRLAINNNLSLHDISSVVDAIERCYPQALRDEQQSIAEIGKHFRMDFGYAKHLDAEPAQGPELELKHFTSIHQVDKSLWDSLLGTRGSFDWDGCRFLEDVFIDNPEPENNWNFHYYFVYENGRPVLATFVTELLCKDDMLAPESVSGQVENERKVNPYYLTSKVMMMGCMLTEGEHLYLDKSTGSWHAALDLFIKHVQQQQEACGASTIQLRDIDSEDAELGNYLLNRGFVKSDMPDSWVVESLDWENENEMIEQLSYKSRHHLRKDVLRYTPLFTVKAGSHANTASAQWKALYNNVKQKSLKLNTFSLPDSIFEKIKLYPSWETIELFMNTASGPRLVSVVFAYKNGENYCPMFIGLDYAYQQSYNVYKQSLFQIVRQARKTGAKKVYLGMEAGMEKKKLNAKPYKRLIFIQTNENYNYQKLGDYNVLKIS